MFKLSSHITIETNPRIGGRGSQRYEFDFVTDVNIKTSWKSLTDTCEITFPRNLRWEGGTRLVNDSRTNPVLARGDKVTVELGYDDNLETAFVGYINKIYPDAPVKIECEDKSWFLKYAAIDPDLYSLAVSNIPIIGGDLISYVLPVIPTVISLYAGQAVTGQSRFQDFSLDFRVRTLDNFGRRVKLGNYRFPTGAVKQNTAYALLEEFKQYYSIYSWFREETLYVGWRDGIDVIDGLSIGRKEVDLHFQENIISHNLDYVHFDDHPLVVEAYGTPLAANIVNPLSPTMKGRAFLTNIGSGSARVKRLDGYEGLSGSDLAAVAERFRKVHRFTGYKGTLETFGERLINHGDVVALGDNRHPEREGTYLVCENNIRFGASSGYRQNISLERKVNKVGNTYTELDASAIGFEVLDLLQDFLT
ncbi:MAG: hypothetical protein AAFX87_24955 [Bacteroidota bacterium]